MINSLTSFLIRKKRLQSKLTIGDASTKIGVDKTYLSKLEKNKSIPSERRLKQIYHLYNMKSYNVSYIDFNELFINNFLNKIYYIDVSENDIINLDKMIEKHQSSIYLGHLILLKWCYKSLKGLWDNEFLSDINGFLSSFNLLSDEEQNFFLLCFLFYCVRSKNFDKYNRYLPNLNKINKHKWLGLEYHIIVNYDYYTNNYLEMPKHIEKAKKYLLKDKNYKRLNSTLQYEGIYYNIVRDYEKELNIYHSLIETYKKSNQLINYGVTKQNIASLLLEQKKYDEAIENFLEGLKYNSLNGPYFELAWCYYNINEMDLCKNAIEQGKNAKKQIPYYNDFLDWLFKMTESPYSKSCLNLLLKIDKKYNSTLTSDMKNFLNVAIANNYIKLNQIDHAYDYLKKTIDESLPLTVKVFNHYGE